MKKTQIASAISLIVLATSLVSVSTAFATTTYPSEGGKWDYGVSPLTTVYSNYYHATRTHGSTACNGIGGCTRSVDTQRGNTSYASRTPTAWGNTAYYRVS